jgi:hypothetical protein
MFTLKEHVANICFECFRCFKGMLQLFYIDVAKVDWDVAYVAIVVHVCCKGLLPMFHLCLSGCCICFTHMLHVFYLDVAYVCKGFEVFLGVFFKVSEACCKCAFQMFQTYVASVLSECCICCSRYTHMLQAYKYFIYFRRTLQQVLHAISVS